MLFAPVFGGLLLGGMLILASERNVYERVKSPDGWHEARVQFDDGGAVSSFERLVFVKGRFNPSDEPLASCRAFLGHGEAKISLSWQNNNMLLIQHHVAPENVADVATNCGSVRIVARGVLPYEKF